MRRADHVVHAQQRIVGRHGFGLEHIQRRARDFFGFQGAVQGFLIHRGAASVVDEERRLLHGREMRVGQHVRGLGVQRRVHGDEVRALQQLEQAGHRLHVGAGHLQFGNVGVVGDHPQAEGMAAVRHGLGDVAERNQADGQPPQTRDVGVVRTAFGPAAFLSHAMHQQQAPVSGKEHHHGVIRHLVDEHVRHVGDDDAAIRRRFHVHGVRADAAEADHHALVETLDDVAADAASAGDQGVRVILHGGDELRLVLGRHFDDFRANGIERFAFDLVARVRQVVGNAHLRLHHHFVLRHVLSRC